MSSAAAKSKMSIRQAVMAIAATRLENYRVTSSDQVESLCPFPHTGQEKKHKRTFYVSLQTGLWICHRCGRRGSIVTLANRLHVNVNVGEEIVEEERRARRYREAVRKRVDVLPNWVADLFARRGPQSLVDAGFEVATLAQHKIGVDVELDRWVVPIYSRDGRLRAISGRATLPMQEPKYLVYRRRELLGLLTDETLEEYEPRPKNYLWREHLIPDRPDVLVLCEGYKAAMWAAQYGYDSVALMSNIPTRQQVDTIRRLEPRIIVVALDNDDAGKKGTVTTVRMVRHLARTFVISYPEGADGFSPDDLDEPALHQALGRMLTPIRWRLENHVIS